MTFLDPWRGLLPGRGDSHQPLAPAIRMHKFSTEWFRHSTVFRKQQSLGNRDANAGSAKENSLLNREYGFGFDSLFRNLVPHVHFQSVDAWL
jgi:hypothetical protein